MANWPPDKGSDTVRYREIELIQFNPEEIDEAEALPVAQAEEIVEEQAQQVAAVQNNNMDIAEIGAVAGMLIPLVVLFLIFLGMNGFGPPNRGGGFRGGSANMRDGAAGRLQGARPTVWSGARRGAADSYDDKVREQRNAAEMIAAADEQIADTLESQAGAVELGRQGLEVAICALLGGIAVAEVMEAKWKALAAVGSPAAPAMAAALVIFAKALACATGTAALGMLTFQVIAGTQNQTAFHQSRDQYQRVAGDLAATTPTGWVPEATAPIVADFCDVAGPLSDTSSASGTSPDQPDVAGAAGVVAVLPETVATLGELAELCKQATGFGGRVPKTSTQATAAENPLVAQVQWWAAMAQHAEPAAAGAQADSTPVDKAILGYPDAGHPDRKESAAPRR